MNIVYELVIVRIKFYLIKLRFIEGEVFDYFVMGNKNNKGNKKQVGKD